MPTLDLGYTDEQLLIFFPQEVTDLNPEPQPERRFNIFPCGRRFGKTQGAAHACIEWAVEGMPILWGDTINANIERYWDRYFEPPLKDSGIAYHFNKQSKVAKIGSGYIDFRSADNPANWEGFGYRKIILNEAGVILGDKDGNKGPYLYANAVLPMMIDHTDSQLYAIGVPKGQKLKSGEEHPFFTLWKRVGEDSNYRGQQFSSYANPLLSPTSIEELEKEIAIMAPGEEQQEIGAAFREGAAGEKFAHCYDDAKHKRPVLLRPLDVHKFSIDFNVHPFCAIMGYSWQDGTGVHAGIAREVVIRAGTVNEMAGRMLTICPHRHLIRLTGDKGGDNERIRTSDNISLFEELRKALGVTTNQVVIKANPRHKVSREQTNYVLVHHPDFAIDPSCSGLITDCRIVEVDTNGEILKSDRTKASQKADLLDALRYWVNTYLAPWVDAHRKHPSHVVRGHLQGTGS